jgi:primary-amine oxidase
MKPFLDAEANGTTTSLPARIAMVQTFLGPRDSDHFFQLKVDVATGKVVEKKQLVGCHPHVDANDMKEAEQACLNDPRVQAAIKDMQLPEGAEVRIEPWTYATDGMYDMSNKITMVGARRTNVLTYTVNR